MSAAPVIEQQIPSGVKPHRRGGWQRKISQREATINELLNELETMRPIVRHVIRRAQNGDLHARRLVTEALNNNGR